MLAHRNWPSGVIVVITLATYLQTPALGLMCFRPRSLFLWINHAAPQFLELKSLLEADVAVPQEEYFCEDSKKMIDPLTSGDARSSPVVLLRFSAEGKSAIRTLSGHLARKQVCLFRTVCSS